MRSPTTGYDPALDADHVRMMQNPDDWPVWPVLPVKRRNSDGSSWPELGLMVAIHEYRYRVYHATIPELRQGPLAPQLATIDSTVYTDAEAIVDAGWRVD